jgi:A/G-specific adenine glycosylase
LKINNLLINWYNANKRDLPWRHTKDAYRIWLSEVMLQQTRVAQGLPYYEKFVDRYPTVYDMAQADEQEILTLWQGLGYYSRARNMHATAKIVVDQYSGLFPKSYAAILSLKGIGEYTAAAISSFAFDLPHPVVDGNVYRVISRLFAIEEPINKPLGQKSVRTAVHAVFDKQQPALFNQAIMEFGALHCTPKKPLCTRCPIQDNCLALDKGLVDKLPLKEGKTNVKNVVHSYLYFQHKQNTYIEKRESGIWQNLHQFPLAEENLNPSQLIKKANLLIKNKINIKIGSCFSTTHLLSHRKIAAHFYTIFLDEKPIFSKSNIFEIDLEQMGTKYPTSVLTKKFLNQKKNDDK